MSCGDDADAPQPIAEAPQPAFTLQLLHLSDMDGSDATALASVANMSAQIERLKASYPAATLLLSSGDNYIPGPRFNAANDPALSAPSLLGKAEVGQSRYGDGNRSKAAILVGGGDIAADKWNAFVNVEVTKNSESHYRDRDREYIVQGFVLPLSYSDLASQCTSARAPARCPSALPQG